MKKNGFTLLEVIIAVLIGSIVVLIMTIQFIADYRFREVINKEVTGGREVRQALREMTNVLRFAYNFGTIAQPPAPDGELPPAPVSYDLQNLFLADIKPGCFPNNPFLNSGPRIWYYYDSGLQTIQMYYGQRPFETEGPVIAYNVTNFHIDFSPGSYITLNITVRIGQAAPVSAQTTIYPIGGYQ